MQTHVNHTGMCAHTQLHRNCWKDAHFSNFLWSSEAEKKSFLIFEPMCIIKVTRFPFLLQLLGCSDLNL